MSLNRGQITGGRYRVVSLLGQGGMGAVYRAWDMRLNVPIALKEMTSQPGLDPRMLTQLRQQFQREAAVLAGLDHPYLVGVGDFFEERGNAYLVMRFVEGENLADRIKRLGALPETEVRAWAGQLLGALAYCHTQGIIHRDISPQNVIITPSPTSGAGRGGGQAVLVDFGLVKLWDPRNPRTQTAIRGMGKPGYAPPEQYDTGAGHTDARSDLYSLGATLYHALTGQAPPTATMRIMNPSALVPVRRLNPQVSPYMEFVLMRALELQPQARFQSAVDMLAAIRQGGVAAPGTAPQYVPGRSPAPAPQSPSFPPTVRQQTSRGKKVGLVLGALAVATFLVSAICLGVVIPKVVGEPRTAPATTAAVVTGPTATSKATEIAPVTATAIATPEPTRTPQPTSTPAPFPTTVPSPTTAPPAPSCPSVTGAFSSIWQARQSQLGCAVNTAHTGWMANEHFEGGEMFWREGNDLIYVLYSSRSWVAYSDLWQEGDPEFSCPGIAPSQSPPTPWRGFGKIWCTYDNVRSGLGSATDTERGFNGTVQDFEHGLILRRDTGATYILYSDGVWTKL